MARFTTHVIVQCLMTTWAAGHTLSSSDTAGVTTASTKPNVLVFFADDLGVGDLQAYGHPTTFTPNLNQFAAEGVRFTQWYSGFHVCSPSRAAMMTGRLPIRTGCAGASWTGGVFSDIATSGLPLNETTMAQALLGAGYSTAMIGKWHLGQRDEYLPTSRGFQHYFGIPYSVDMGMSAWRPKAGNRGTVLPLLHNKTVIEQPVNLDTLSVRYGAFASDFIKNESSKGNNWFLYAAFNHVHVPNFVSPKWCNQTLRGLYGDALAELDETLGTIMQAVKDAGVDDNTIQFFSSDNGPWLIHKLNGGSAGLLRDGKTTTWEGGIREPGLVRWPTRIAPAVSEHVVTTYDIFPTVLELAGVPLPTNVVLDGKSMVPVLLNNATSQHDCLFHYKGTPGLSCPKDHNDCPGLWTVRCGAYKLHWVTSTWQNGSNNGVFHDPPLLFNLDIDPGESFPIASNSAEYTTWRATIEAARDAHEKTLKTVPNQMAMGTNADYGVCGCPQSQQKNPKFPNCTCNPENFQNFVCGNPYPLAAQELQDNGGLPTNYASRTTPDGLQMW
eukprot:m.25001 g.25001  ORF g.25001 m.25001 type:complete len:554 (-) comp13130_c0_seq2:1676-3337(-)